MSPMSDQPITLAVLAKFHHDVIVPDIQRVVREEVGASERRMMAHIDGLAHKLTALQIEYAAIAIGLKRVEDRLDTVEKRIGNVGQ